MKFLIHSNGPNVASGYGVQCKLLLERLMARGHEVAVSSTYGTQGGPQTWPTPHGKVRLYPRGYEVNSNDIIHNHAEHWFDGDDGWIIPLLDLWCLVNPRLADFNVAGWCPVDHDPVPPDVAKFFTRNPDAIPLAMSRFGERKLMEVGLNAVYVPLAVDTNVIKPTFEYVTPSGKAIPGREFLQLPADAFVVGMVAMNKGWARDRKGFAEAFQAFAAFRHLHDNAVLYMHTEALGGAEGINLMELAANAGIPEQALFFVDQYRYQAGMIDDQAMAVTYTAFDVLLAPSHGEGFCVPLVEAQACGTPVIASDFSAQTELVGAGWLVNGQREWDPSQHSWYLVPDIAHIVSQLELAYRTDLSTMQARAREFAVQYDADRVFEQFWLPFIDSLTPTPPLEMERELIPEETDAVAVVVPVMRRPENVAPLVESLLASTDQANVYFVCDPDDDAEIDAVERYAFEPRVRLLLSKDGPSYGIKVNVGYRNTTEPWVFACGDDVRFHPGWIDEARKLSDRFDVIGTNDTTGKMKNPDVAAGRHSDHFFVRRTYVDLYGASLDGPGALTPEVYGHWFVDKEIVELAKARGVFTPCLEAVVEHLHPAYDGREDLRAADATYVKAQEHAEEDRRTFMGRAPLIAMQKTRR